MIGKRKRNIASLAFACALTAHTQTATSGVSTETASTASHERYAIVDLGTGSVSGISKNGEIVGSDGSGRPYIYLNGDTRMLPVSSLGPFTAAAINDRGEVVGYVLPPGTYAYYLAIYHHGGLEVRTDVSGVAPTAVNDKGQIAGDLELQYRSFLYSDGTLTAFGPNQTVTRAINQEGEIVGTTSTAAAPQRSGFIYRNGNFSTFSYPGSADTGGDALNNKGEIAGVWTTSSSQQIYTYRDGCFRNLGSAFGVPGEEDGVYAINNFGVIVGDVQASTNPNFSDNVAAFVYFPRDGFHDLNQLIRSGSGWFLQSATGVNDRGEIIGVGYLNGIQHSYLLTPLYPAVSDDDAELDDNGSAGSACVGDK